MIQKNDGFKLNLRWSFQPRREYVFALAALFIFLFVIYANSFQGTWQFDDKPNIIENKNIALQGITWPEIKSTFYGIEGKRIDRPISYFSFALNHYFGGFDVVGYHIVNFTIHYLASIFLFLFIYNTLNLPVTRNKYGPASYSIALLATVFWATSPVQVTAVTYIVQRMASMAGLFYIISMYFYFKGRTADKTGGIWLYGVLSVLAAVLSLGAKENAVMLPVSVWIYDLLLIQGATRQNILKNIKLLAPALLVVVVIGLLYVNIPSLLSGAAYANRPFTLVERLLTQPRVIIFYITLLLYPTSSRLTLIHDIELSRSLLTPWSTLPAILIIAVLLIIAWYSARKRPLISFCIFFYFINHLVESSFLPLELIYEHRNYIPSMFFFVPAAIFVLNVIDYFSYKKTIQLTMAGVFVFLLFAQGHTVFARNELFSHPVLLWTDNVEKTPSLSRPYNNLGAAYWDMGYYGKAYEMYSRANDMDRQTNLSNRGVNLYNLGMYHLNVSGEYDKALSFFESAIKVYPGYCPAYHDAAICFIMKGDLGEAGRRLVAALRLWPDNAELQHSLGFVMLKLGELDLAIKHARLALSINPDLHNAWSIVGEASRRKGQYGMATICWGKYIEKKPDDLEANLALLELYSIINNKSGVMSTIGKLISLRGEHDWAKATELLTKYPKLQVYVPELEKMEAIINNNLCEPGGWMKKEKSGA